MTPRLPQISFGALAALAVLAATAPARADGCTKDTDCKGDRVCEGGRCVGAAPAGSQGQSGPMVGGGAEAGSRDRGSRAGSSDEPLVEGTWPARFGAYYIVLPGLASTFRNAQTGHSVGVDVSVPIAENIRYRATFGFNGVGSLNGFRVEPLSFIYTIGVPLRGRGVRLAVEPSVNILNMETFIDVGGSGASIFFLSTGFGLGFVLGFEKFYLAIEPLGMDFRYTLVTPSLSPSSRGDFGANWRSRFGLGLEF